MRYQTLAVPGHRIRTSDEVARTHALIPSALAFGFAGVVVVYDAQILHPPALPCNPDCATPCGLRRSMISPASRWSVGGSYRLDSAGMADDPLCDARLKCRCGLSEPVANGASGECPLTQHHPTIPSPASITTHASSPASSARQSITPSRPWLDGGRRLRLRSLAMALRPSRPLRNGT